MPQKAKFTKDEIITAATEIAETDGIEALTARALGAKLASSARPVFTVFKNMDEVLLGVQERANSIYQTYVAAGLQTTPAFKGVGTAYIRFADEHPRLFRLLFMTERGETPDIGDVLSSIENSYEKILGSITEAYPVGEESAKRLYIDMWIFSHGIATLKVNKMCRFTDREISDMLTEVFKSLIISEVRGK